MTRSTRVSLLGIVALVATLLAPLVVPGTASAVADVDTDRIGGADRFETAADVARESHPGASTALIANGINFPDALAGAVLAGSVDAPILLVLPDTIPAATSRALADIGVSDVVILGGPAAVSAAVEAQLRQNYGVTRTFGEDRYKTAVEVARRAAIAGIGTVDGLRTAFVTTGQNFPDALGAGPLAYDSNLPIFLTRTNDLPPEVAQAIRDLNIEHVVILGGTQAVSATVETQIEATGVTTERLNGRNRADTATLVADFALARMDFEGVNVILARGDNFPDALAGGPLGGVRRAVILLTATPCQLAVETRDWLEEHFGTVANIIALGGPAAVCEAVLQEAEEAAETNNLPPDMVELTISGGSTNGGPQWQYQQSGASPSKSLSLQALVSSAPASGNEDAERVPASRENVIFNIRPTQGDDPANTELNLSGRTDSNGIARTSYTRAEPGTDIITVRLADEAGVTDDGVGRWSTEEMPISLDPNEAATVPANEPREFTVCVPGGGSVPSIGMDDVNITTLELVDDDPDNDTNKAALIFGDNVVDDRADSDETLGIVTTIEPDGCEVFTVSSNSSQIFTLLAFQDTVATPAANDDNTNPPEFRDIAGPTAFVADQPALNITPANDNSTATTITRRNGRQIVYTVTAVDAQGQPENGPIDVGFQQLTDGNPVTTTTAEFDWFDNSRDPSTQAGLENEVPPTGRATAGGTTRIEVVPNAQGEFTFAIVHPQRNTFGTTGNPIAWIDLPGGRNNRPDEGEPQARGENFAYNAGGLTFNSTLDLLGCPPGTLQRGSAENPETIADPCLGRDILPEDPHVPWFLAAAPVSDIADASTCATDAGTGETDPGTVEPNPDDPPASEVTPPSTSGPTIAEGPNEATISRGDVTARFTFRDEEQFPVDPADGFVTFRVENTSIADVNASPARPNPGCDIGVPVPSFTSVLIDVPLSGRYAELVVDAAPILDDGSVTIDVIAVSVIDGAIFFCDDPEGPESCPITQNLEWLSLGTNGTDTTSEDPIPATRSAANCPMSPTLQPCFNGNLVVIDKARDSYVMAQGGRVGAFAYVVYAVGGGGEFYTQDAMGAFVTGERPSGVDEYLIDGLPAISDPDDNKRCGAFSNSAIPGCARFDAALSFDDRMVYEFAGEGPTRTQTHFLTNGEVPIPDPS